jgi:DNA-binding winged helix-turn-helix (wHTH) protein
MARAHSDACVAFGSYVLRAHSRSLERDGIPVRLGDRAFDILCALTDRAGQIVTNRELMSEVWGRVVVGAGSLRFHINALRKVLAQDGTQAPYIKNVTRRGYTFIAPVRKSGTDLPRRPVDISARAAEIQEIERLLDNATVVESAALIAVILERIALGQQRRTSQ